MCLFTNLAEPCVHEGCDLINTIRRDFSKPWETLSYITSATFE